MALRIIHLLDARTPEDALRLLDLLLRRMPAGRFDQRVIAVGRLPARFDRLIAASAGPNGQPVTRVSDRWSLPLGLSVPRRRQLDAYHPHVLHAWGTSAAALVRSLRPAGASMALTVTDPREIDEPACWWPLHPIPDNDPPVHVLCASDRVRRRLVSLGIPKEVSAVVRQGIAHHPADPARRRRLRADLDLADDARVLLTPSPPSRPGGQFFAAWAAAILYQIWPNVRLICPGRSREQDRIRRLIDSIYCPQIYRLIGDDHTPEDLLSASDLLVAPALGDVPTAWLAAAMTAGLPIVASTAPALAELAADGRIAFTCPPGEPHTLAICIREALESPEPLARCTAAARTWARTAFDPQRSLDAHAAVYTRLAGLPIHVGAVGEMS